MGLTAFFWSTVTGNSLSQVDVAGAGRGRDTGLDEYAVAGSGRGHVTGAQVAHRPRSQRQHTRVADAHPATRWHQYPVLLTRIQDRGGAVQVEGDSRTGEPDCAAFARLGKWRAEPLG